MSGVYGRPSNLLLHYGSYVLSAPLLGVRVDIEVGGEKLGSLNFPNIVRPILTLMSADGDPICTVREGIENRLRTFAVTDVNERAIGKVRRRITFLGALSYEIVSGDKTITVAPRRAQSWGQRLREMGNETFEAVIDGTIVATMRPNHDLKARRVELEFVDSPDFSLDRRMGFVLAWVSLRVRQGTT